MNRIKNPEWLERVALDDESIDEYEELSPLDDDYISEEYRDDEE